MICITKMLNYCLAFWIIVFLGFVISARAETPEETADRIAKEEQAEVEKVRKAKLVAEITAKTKESEHKAAIKAEESRKASEAIEAAKAEKARKAKNVARDAVKKEAEHKLAVRREDERKAEEALQARREAEQQYEQEQLAIQDKKQQEQEHNRNDAAAEAARIERKYQQEQRETAQAEETLCRSREADVKSKLLTMSLGCDWGSEINFTSDDCKPPQDLVDMAKRCRQYWVTQSPSPSSFGSGFDSGDMSNLLGILVSISSAL